MIRFHPHTNWPLIVGAQPDTGRDNSDFAGRPDVAFEGLLDAALIETATQYRVLARTRPDGDKQPSVFCWGIDQVNWPPTSPDDFTLLNNGAPVLGDDFLDSDPVYGSVISDIVADYIAADPVARANFELYGLDIAPRSFRKDASSFFVSLIVRVKVWDPNASNGEFFTGIQADRFNVFCTTTDGLSFTDFRLVVRNGSYSAVEAHGAIQDSAGDWLACFQDIFRISDGRDGYAKAYAQLGIIGLDPAATADAGEAASMPGTIASGAPVVRFNATPSAALWDTEVDSLSGYLDDSNYIQTGFVREGDNVFLFAISNSMELANSKEYDPETMTDPATNYRDTAKYHDNPEGIVVWRAPYASIDDPTAYVRGGPCFVRDFRHNGMWSINFFKVGDKYWGFNEVTQIYAAPGSDDYANTRNRHYGLYNAPNGVYSTVTILESHMSSLNDAWDAALPSNSNLIRAFGGKYLTLSGERLSLASEGDTFILDDMSEFIRIGKGAKYLAPRNTDVTAYNPRQSVTLEAGRFNYGNPEGFPGWGGPYADPQSDPEYSGPGSDPTDWMGLISARPRRQQWYLAQRGKYYYIQNRWCGMWLTARKGSVLLDRWRGGPEQLFRFIPV